MTTQLTLELRDESYHSLDDLGAKQKTVYNTIREHATTFSLIRFPLGDISPEGITNKQIAEVLNWPINCVTGRVNELMKLGLIEPAGKVYDATTNRNVTIFKITDHV